MLWKLLQRGWDHNLELLLPEHVKNAGAGNVSLGRASTSVSAAWSEGTFAPVANWSNAYYDNWKR